MQGVAEVDRHDEGPTVVGGEPFHAESEQVRNAGNGDRHRVDVHTGDVRRHPADRVAVRHAGLLRCGEVAANGVEQEGARAACHVRDALRQGLVYVRVNDGLSQPVGGVVLA